jgi:ribosome-binding protein aMBF1 (putative translation factor)
MQQKGQIRSALIEARLKKGYSQIDLAKKIKIDKSSLCKIERGLTEGKLSTWDSLELVLGIPQQLLRKKG